MIEVIHDFNFKSAKYYHVCEWNAFVTSTNAEDGSFWLLKSDMAFEEDTVDSMYFCASSRRK